MPHAFWTLFELAGPWDVYDKTLLIELWLLVV